LHAKLGRRIDEASTSAPVVAGIRISHPDRMIYPEPGFTKLDLVRFYESIGHWIVPHVKGRPLTLVHCPNGMLAECRYMRHTKVWGPTALRRVKIREKTKIGEYLVADDLAGVIALIQMGVVEIHTWNSTIEEVERPNRIVWDLDPGPDVSWARVVAAARALRAVLDILKLESWIKTTGGRGLHIVVPIVPQRDWSECLAFARAVADVLVRADPARFTTAFAKRGRESKVLIDYLRNNRTNTSVAAFSTRARMAATVSVPIAWNELARARPETLTVNTVERRLKRLRADPWQQYWVTRQRVTDAVLKAVTRL
jgi:bifunctional non-homologous end joining protein LigD